MHSLCRTILFILRRVAKFKNLNMATHKCISINSREFHSAATQLSLGIFLPFRLWTACCGQAVQLWEALCYGLWQAQDMTCRQQYENSLGLKLMGLRVGFLLGLFLVGFFCFGCGCGLVFFTPPPPPTPPPFPLHRENMVYNTNLTQCCIICWKVSVLGYITIYIFSEWLSYPCHKNAKVLRVL